MDTSRRSDLWLRLILIGLFLVAWEVLSHNAIISPKLISAPSAVAKQSWTWMSGGYIWPHVWVTVNAVVLGYVIGAVLGAVSALLFVASPLLAEVLDPFMSLMNAIPRVILAPLFILWLGLGLPSKVAVVVVLIYFLVFFNVYAGLRGVDKELLDNTRMLGATTRQLINWVYMPGVVVWLTAGLRVAVGFAFIGAIVAEFVGSNSGLGYVIALSESMGNVDGVFAGLAIILIIAASMEFGLRQVEVRYSQWKLF